MCSRCRKTDGRQCSSASSTPLYKAPARLHRLLTHCSFSMQTQTSMSSSSPAAVALSRTFCPFPRKPCSELSLRRTLRWCLPLGMSRIIQCWTMSPMFAPPRLPMPPSASSLMSPSSTTASPKHVGAWPLPCVGGLSVNAAAWRNFAHAQCLRIRCARLPCNAKRSRDCSS